MHFNPLFIRMFFLSLLRFFRSRAKRECGVVCRYDNDRLGRGTSYVTFISKPKDLAGDRLRNGAQ